ncbi:hypothetical protein F511_01153 [Dorcoceras hygrometricum]|nr:hypothetical protein F511_01153 [Dorcoceras hygrometricum]
MDEIIEKHRGLHFTISDLVELRLSCLVVFFELRGSPRAAAAAPRRCCSGQLFEENPSTLISSGLLVQADEGVSLLVVDLIDESTAAYREEPVFL